MKKFFIALVLFYFGFMTPANAQSPCSAKKNIATEYATWKKDFHRFLSEYENLTPTKRFETSKDALKNILTKMQIFSEKTLIPAPESTMTHAKGLLTEVEAGRMAHLTANPILKSSLKKLEDTMDEMLSKAQFVNPNCEFVVN